MLFKINGKDYSKNILVGTYEVNVQDEEIDSWTDATGRTHKTVIDKVKGSMSMWFRTNADYWQFQEDLQRVRDKSTSAYHLTVSANNRQDAIESYFFIECNPTRGRNVANQDEFRDFELTIEER